ncbi:MAG TPA: 3-phosphoshikimate 1-carboxyvinyltransferase [Gemmatimonadota bacterium]|nr:3-phosphoshikimate 1-carboxyvinyltransferase [Gemmatimonadota bacterium]
MTRIRLARLDPPRGTLRVPGDKSIGHRALLLNAIAEGRSVVRGLPAGQDLAATLGALRSLGASIAEVAGGGVRIEGGARWRAETAVDCGNSGTTARLLLGILAPRAAAPVTLAGDASLSRRPMARVVEPLRKMGARIDPGAGSAGPVPDRLPLVVTGSTLNGGTHRLAVASAQVKSALLLAGLAARGPTVVEEPEASRDHTERMLERMGATIRRDETRTEIEPGALAALDLQVPGDISSAAPFLALAAAREGSRLTVRGVGLNPTRTGFLEVLGDMGARVEIEVEAEDPEPRGTVRVEGRGLSGIRLGPAAIPRLIDELPLVAVLASRAEGETVVTGAAELRVKESDRIEAVVRGLRALGATIDALPDGFAVRGPAPLRGTLLDAASDHRIGMALAVAAALAEGESALDGAEWVDVSFPGFFELLAAGAPVPT